jgi:hypothetical protein
VFPRSPSLLLSDPLCFARTQACLRPPARGEKHITFVLLVVTLCLTGWHSCCVVVVHSPTWRGELPTAQSWDVPQWHLARMLRASRTSPPPKKRMRSASRQRYNSGLPVHLTSVTLFTVFILLILCCFQKAAREEKLTKWFLEMGVIQVGRNHTAHTH